VILASCFSRFIATKQKSPDTKTGLVWREKRQPERTFVLAGYRHLLRVWALSSKATLIEGLKKQKKPLLAKDFFPRFRFDFFIR